MAGGNDLGGISLSDTGGMMTERRKMKKTENVWFLLGALAVLAMGIPYLILGKDAIFVYHDQ